MASAPARSLQNPRVHASRLWQSMSLMEARSRSISDASARPQVQKPAEVAPQQTFEAEPVDIPTPKDRKKLLVLGGNGFVGSHVCKEALERGLPVLSLNRSGRPSVHEPWVNDVTWIQGSLFETHKWRDCLSEVSAVISCVGGFGSNDQMRKINGDANISAINESAATGEKPVSVMEHDWTPRSTLLVEGCILKTIREILNRLLRANRNAASTARVERFVFVSAADYNLPFVLRGYYEGKKAAEEALRSKFPYSGVILRPGFIHGTRRVGSMNIPLSVIGGPLERLFRNSKQATQLPVIGPLLIPPVKVDAVAKAAVRAATDNAVPPGVLDVWGIIRFGEHP